MFCQKCGTKVEEGVTICTHCGNKIGDGIPAAQSNNQTTNTVNKTVTCQWCLLNTSGVCAYYGSVINEAEKYDCRMRGSPELQRQQKNSGGILLGVVVALMVITVFLISYLSESIFGLNFWMCIVISFLIVLPAFSYVYSLIVSNRRKNRKKNVKRLS